MKKKVFFFRGSLYLLQHLAFVFAIVCSVILLLNSFLIFEYVSGNQTYSNMHFVNPLDSSVDFGESEVFTDLLNRSVEEIARFAVIKEQMEVDGEFDGKKLIDIVTYANRKERVSGEEHQSLFANYYLEDLIKWGRYKESYTEVYFESIWSAVSYYDKNVLDKYFYVTEIYAEDDFHFQYDGDSYYYIDPNGIYVPVYKGAASGCTFTFSQEEEKSKSTEADIEELVVIAEEDVNTLHAAPSMMDMVVSTAYYYEIRINSSSEDYVLVSDETIPGAVINMLEERYETIGGNKILDLSSCWKDYFTLSDNLVYSIDALSYNYNQYQMFKEEYDQSNLQFCLSMMIDGEWVFFGSNGEEFKDNSIHIDDYFRNNYDKYIIYYLGEMLYITNTNIEEQKIFEELNNYSYAYPENTRLWIGIDTNEFSVHDKFAKAAMVFGEFMPKAWLYMLEVALGLLCWGISFIHLCFVTGKRNEGQETEYTHLYWFDKMPTEIELILGIGLSVVYAVGIDLNLMIVGENFTEIVETKPTWIYVNAAVQAMVLSLLITVFLYSFVRRFKAKNIWKNSITRYVCAILGKGIRFVLSKMKAFVVLVYDNGKTMTRIVLPFMILVGLNVLAGVFFYRYLYAGMSYGKFFFSLSLRSVIVCGILIFIGIADIGALAVLVWNQANRNKIVDGINQICKGDMSYKIDMDSMHGDNRTLAGAVNNISDSMRLAVETSMKDEKLKADLITNVSHDIKTPLTSIINYVDLLKRENVETEPIKSYIAVLDSKSQRLKQLTDDLVEASKITSGNITLIIDRINLTELLNQAVGEFEEKLSQRDLKLVVGYEKKPVCIMADSRRIWRVMENLLNNVCKYAMEGTRVYLDMWVKENQVEVSIKNISAQSLNIAADELTERFIRGDVSRSTEGSGLGLSIAKSLILAQGGEFKIYLDGDLFKVTIVFPVAEERKVEE